MKVWSSLKPHDADYALYHLRNALGYPECQVRVSLQPVTVRPWRYGTSTMVNTEGDLIALCINCARRRKR